MVYFCNIFYIKNKKLILKLNHEKNLLSPSDDYVLCPTGTNRYDS